ncbi:MAG: outer membrane protein assembly factor BamE [Deltaproteobacteria bacterium]|nr:outer membrane protein assembly factor BamE [Deltaproteobacteria bacterium]
MAAVLAAACRPAVSPQVLQRFAGRDLFTCCNVHYESENINDANYWVGKTLPAGTPVRVEKATRDSVTFVAADVKLTLTHEYGSGQEAPQQYFDKVLSGADPRPRIAAYPAAVRRAIDSGKVERGMTRNQVIASLGYPPTHRTTSLQEREWTYWYNRWITYKVVFDDAGKVADVVGRPAPTAEVPILNADAPPKPGPSKPPAKRQKKK